MEYLHHFQLGEDPFRNDHLDRFMADTPSQTEAFRRLDRGVRQGRGLVVLTGAVGSGKTTVARRLYEELEEEMFEAGMMVVLRSQADAQWLLARFASQLGVEDPAKEREALVGQIYERLAIIREDGRQAVLIIDDAQALATPATLAELIGLAKLEYEDRRLLTIVLVGSTVLEGTLASDPQIAHHVEVKVRIARFESEESTAYLAHRLRVAKGDSKLLLPGAVACLHELSEGAPGRLNTLADNALFEAYLAKRGEVTRSDVERAHADLGWSPASAVERSTPALPRRPLTPSLAETTAPDVVASFDDLDSELEAVFEPEGDALDLGAQSSRLMDFDAGPSGGVGLASTGSVAAPTEIQLQPADALEPPPKEDDVDGLFMELLED